MKIIRFSKRPSKQLFWFFVHRDMKNSLGKMVGLDIGCGAMLNYGLFKTSSYIGLDLDKQRLEAGKKKYPKSIPVYSSIEECKNIKGDFLLCAQVFNNIFFKKEMAIDAVKKLCSMVNDSGDMIFNIGKDVIKYESEIDLMLHSEFNKVNKIKYGAPYSNKQFNVYASLLLAVFMLFIPPLRRIRRHDYVYYFCQNKK